MGYGRLGTARRALPYLSSLAFLLLLPTAAVAQGFQIDNWTENLELRKDAVIHVEERISVTFKEQSRGILRDIPVSYATGRNTTRNIFLKGLKVVDEKNKPINFYREDYGGKVHLKIGNANIFLPTGTKRTYVIRYLVTNGVNWFDDKTWVPSAELYWNVTGNDWPVNIRALKVNLKYPKVTAKDKVRIKVFTGALGDRTSHLVDKRTKSSANKATGTTISLSDTGAKITRTQPLPTGHGLTVVFNVPITYVPKKKVVEERLGNSSDYAGGSTYSPYYGSARSPSYGLLEDESPNLSNEGVIACFLVPLATLIFMTLMWLLFGKDPPSKPIVVQYDPPEGLNGPQCGVMIDETVDTNDYAAGIISLAVKGYIRIRPYESGLWYRTMSATIEVLHRKGMDDISPFEMQLLSHISSAGDVVTDMDLRTNVAPYIPQMRDTLYDEMVDKGFYPASPDGVRTTWFVVSIFLIGMMGLYVYYAYPGSFVILAFAGIIALLIAYAFSRAMPRRTLKGSEVRDKVIGFEEFISRARAEELRYLTDKDPSAALFEKYLPHAVAFGLTKEWADAFKDMLKAPPSWYLGDYTGAFDAVSFATDLITVSTAVSSFMTTPPRSNNSGGGSSSGFWTGGGFSSGFSGFSSGGGGFGGGSSSGGGGGGGYSGGGAGGGGGGKW